MFMDLLVMFTVVLLIWFAFFRWKRRRLYKLASKFDGPPTVPLFGYALTLIGPKHKNLFKTKYIRIFNYESPIKFWILHKLIFWVYDPVNFETILNSPHALEKHEMYKFVNTEGETLFNSSVPTWKAHKKIIAPTFNQKILDGFVKVFFKQANTLVDKLEKHAGMGIFNVYETVHIATIKAISETALGHEIREETLASNIVHWMDKFLGALCSRMTFNLFHYYDFTFRMTAKVKEYSDVVKHGRNTIEKIVNKKIEDYERVKQENHEVQLEEENIMKTAYGGTLNYRSPIKLWIVHQLYFCVYDPVNFETILNSPHALEKQAMYKFSNSLGVGLFNANVPMWKKHKKLITPTFNQKILDGFVKIFSQQANILIDQLEEHAGKGIFDVYEAVNIFTIKTISETTLGHEIREETLASNLAHWIDTFMAVLCSRMTFNLLYYYDFTFKMTAKGKEFYDIVKNGRIIIQKIIDTRRKEYEKVKKENYEVLEEVASKRTAFLPKLIELSDKGKGLTDTEIENEVAIMLMAGSDTTATMISYIFMMLGMHPEIQEKVYKEVIDTVGLDRPIEHTDLQDLSYTELVVKETLRILPVGPMVARAITGDIELKDGRVIPEGASVIISIIHAHRNPEYWPDPLKFDPLRFLPEESAKRHRYCFLPFVGGPRKCIGIQYAMMSMKVTVATVIRKYVIKTCYKQPKDIKLSQNIASKPVDGFLISLEKRSSQ